MNKSELNNFINPKSQFRGEINLPNLMFDDNLQEFANKIAIIVGLENNGKIAPIDAYLKIKKLFKELKKSKKNLLKEE